MLRLSGEEFDDIRMSGGDWGTKYKAMSPTGHAPFLELDDGSTMGHSLAIYLFTAKRAGYLPDDALGIGRTVELRDAFEEVRDYQWLCA